MEVPLLVWIPTIGGIVAPAGLRLLLPRPQGPHATLKESAVWSAIYVGIALLFGVGVLDLRRHHMGAEYFAGYITEKALSVDNLFVFLMIMASFRVPREDQQKVLLFGIVFSLIARTGFIFLGAALINSFAWVFYIFGLILLITAGNLLKPDATTTTAKAWWSGSPRSSCRRPPTTTATSSSPWKTASASSRRCCW